MSYSGPMYDNKTTIGNGYAGPYPIGEKVTVEDRDGDAVFKISQHTLDLRPLGKRLAEKFRYWFSAFVYGAGMVAAAYLFIVLLGLVQMSI